MEKPISNNINLIYGPHHLEWKLRRNPGNTKIYYTCNLNPQKCFPCTHRIIISLFFLDVQVSLLIWWCMRRRWRLVRTCIHSRSNIFPDRHDKSPSRHLLHLGYNLFWCGFIGLPLLRNWIWPCNCQLARNNRIDLSGLHLQFAIKLLRSIIIS